jgi:hypothetical protein
MRRKETERPRGVYIPLLPPSKLGMRRRRTGPVPDVYESGYIDVELLIIFPPPPPPPLAPSLIQH